MQTQDHFRATAGVPSRMGTVESQLDDTTSVTLVEDRGCSSKSADKVIIASSAAAIATTEHQAVDLSFKPDDCVAVPADLEHCSMDRFELLLGDFKQVYRYLGQTGGGFNISQQQVRHNIFKQSFCLPPGNLVLFF